MEGMDEMTFHSTDRLEQFLAQEHPRRLTHVEFCLSPIQKGPGVAAAARPDPPTSPADDGHRVARVVEELSTRSCHLECRTTCAGDDGVEKDTAARHSQRGQSDVLLEDLEDSAQVSSWEIDVTDDSDEDESLQLSASMYDDDDGIERYHDNHTVAEEMTVVPFQHPGGTDLGTTHSFVERSECFLKLEDAALKTVLLRGASASACDSETSAAVTKTDDNASRMIIAPERNTSPEVTTLERDTSPAVTTPERNTSPEVTTLERDTSPAVTTPERNTSPAVTTPERNTSPEVTTLERDTSPAVTTPERNTSPAVSTPERNTSPTATTHVSVDEEDFCYTDTSGKDSVDQQVFCDQSLRVHRGMFVTTGVRKYESADSTRGDRVWKESAWSCPSQERPDDTNDAQQACARDHDSSYQLEKCEMESGEHAEEHLADVDGDTTFVSRDSLENAYNDCVAEDEENVSDVLTTSDTIDGARGGGEMASEAATLATSACYVDRIEQFVSAYDLCHQDRFVCRVSIIGEGRQPQKSTQKAYTVTEGGQSARPWPPVIASNASAARADDTGSGDDMGAKRMADVFVLDASRAERAREDLSGQSDSCTVCEQDPLSGGVSLQRKRVHDDDEVREETLQDELDSLERLSSSLANSDDDDYGKEMRPQADIDGFVNRRDESRSKVKTASAWDHFVCEAAVGTDGTSGLSDVLTDECSSVAVSRAKDLDLGAQQSTVGQNSNEGVNRGQQIITAHEPLCTKDNNVLDTDSLGHTEGNVQIKVPPGMITREHMLVLDEESARPFKYETEDSFHKHKGELQESRSQESASWLAEESEVHHDIDHGGNQGGSEDQQDKKEILLLPGGHRADSLQDADEERNTEYCINAKEVKTAPSKMTHSSALEEEPLDDVYTSAIAQEVDENVACVQEKEVDSICLTVKADDTFITSVGVSDLETSRDVGNISVCNTSAEEGRSSTKTSCLQMCSKPDITDFNDIGEANFTSTEVRKQFRYEDTVDRILEENIVCDDIENSCKPLKKSLKDKNGSDMHSISEEKILGDRSEIGYLLGKKLSEIESSTGYAPEASTPECDLDTGPERKMLEDESGTWFVLGEKALKHDRSTTCTQASETPVGNVTDKDVLKNESEKGQVADEDALKDKNHVPEDNILEDESEPSHATDKDVLEDESEKGLVADDVLKDKNQVREENILNDESLTGHVAEDNILGDDSELDDVTEENILEAESEVGDLADKDVLNNRSLTGQVAEENILDDEGGQGRETGENIVEDESKIGHMAEENIVEDETEIGHITEENILEDESELSQVTGKDVLEDESEKGPIADDVLKDNNQVREENILNDESLTGLVAEDNILEDMSELGDVTEENILEDESLKGHAADKDVLKDESLTGQVAEDNILEDESELSHVTEEKILENVGELDCMPVMLAADVCCFVEREEQFLSSDGKCWTMLRSAAASLHFDSRDKTSAPHEHLLEDIKSNKVHTEMVVQQQSSMGIPQGDVLPSPGNRLLRDIEQLEETAERQCSQLRLAVTEQEQYDTELRHLHAAISEAQQQLLASPVRASSVEALKQQIAEHNSLASQIKTYQAKISEINEKSRQLSLRVAQASTCVDRKRYLPEMIYRKWGSSASLDVGIDVQSAPVSSASHTIDSASFDSVLDGFTSSSQSQQTSPSLTVMTEYSSSVLSQKPLAVSGRSPGDASSVTFEAVHFKPITEKSQMKSLAFQPTVASSKLSTDVKNPASGVLTWQGLSGSAESYSFKSASDSDISSCSLGKKAYLGAKSDGRSSQFGQVTIPRLTTDIPRLLSKQDDSATTSTPRREKRAWSTSVHTPGTGRRSFSYSPDKGRKLYQSPQMQSLSPALQSTFGRGRGSGAVLVGAGGGGVYLGKASKLEGEIMQSTEPRARSASFGQRAEPLGLPLGSSPDTAQINITWNSLQKQIAAKEHELQMALQKQEKYQQAVQDLNAKMERAQIYLTRTPATSAADINMQMKEYREGVSELESIKEDIVRVQERGHQIMEISDPESQKAMEATLKMLSDRFSSLQTVADQRGKQLQDAVKHRNKHDIALSAYKKRVSDLEKWLTEMKIAHASSALPTEEPSALQQQLQDNRDLQDEITSYLQQISDLAVQCDNLCELEQPAEAEKLRSNLASLQSSLGNFKFTAIEKETALRSSIREAEKRRREMEDYEKNVQKLQQWMTDTKQMTLSSEPSSGSMTLPGHLQLHQEIASDLSQHQQLVRQLSVTAPSQKGLEKLQRTAATEARQLAISSVSEEELHLRWEKLQRELAQKTKELENILQRKKSGDKILSLGQSVGDTSVQLEEVQGLVQQLTQCWQQLQVQVVDKQQRLDTVLSFQQQMQSAFGAISSWLDLAEQMVFTSKEAQSEHEQIRQNESLQRELRSLQSEIVTLSAQAKALLSGTSVQSHGLIQESLTSLTQRVGMLESQAAAHSTELHQSQLQWQQYHEDVRFLRSSMQELQTSVVVPHTGSSANLDSLVSDVHKIESQLKKCENQLSELKARERELSARHPRGLMLSDLNTLHNSFLELQRKVAERKGSLLLSVSVQEQYEKMLKDYAYFLETAEGKLGSESISARDLSHLKQQLSAHKEFFSDLEVHKAMLDSLAAQCDSSTQETHSLQHTRLSNLTHVLADKASLHGQRLDRAVRQWVELDSKLQHLRHFLEQVEEGIPKPVATGDSLATIQEKLVKFKRLQGQLTDERPAVFQVVDKGKQILHSVACTALETALTELAEKWVELNAQLGQELKKTETIGEQLQIFETEAMVLKAWMSTANKKLDILQYLTEEDMQNIGNIRTKVEHVLEFRKEVQNQIPLKNKVLSVGRQLMENSNYDTRGLDVRLDSIEQEWSQLEQAVSTAEQSLHQAQMELMPSRQALHELQLWMEDMERMLDIDANTPIKNIADNEVMLKKYKGHKVDLASKQLTVDFVNQAVLQPGPHEKDVPHEKLEFAEKLAEVNHHWQKVSSAINERLRSLEQLAGKWSEYEGALAQMHAWFRQQEDKLKQYRLIGHEVGVKQTLKDCKAMQEQLKARKEDMDSIERLGQSLIDLSKESAGCQHSVRHSLSAVWQQWEHLQQQTMQLENLLTDMLGQWARYHTDLHSLSQVLGQIEYTLNRYSLLGADIKALSNQVEKLKNLEAELKQHSSHLDSYTALASQLCQVCEPPVQAEVQSSVIDLKTRWSRLSADLSTRRAEFERSLAKWKEYEQEYRHISAWLEQKEQECSRLVTMREDVTAREECLNKSETLQQELDGIQTQLSNLYRLSDDLTKNMGTSTIVLLTSQQSGVEQRLLALRQLLSQHIQALHEDLSQGNRFSEAFSAVTTFLDHARLVLLVEDPNKAAEQSAIQKRLDQLKQLSSQFQTKTAKLDEVNDLGYRLALHASDASKLIELNHTWYQLLATCQDRCKALQGHLLVQQDFTAKCETWMTFLASVEHDLSAEIAGNLSDLLEQQRKFQNFETDMYSKQQVLHAIISDGQKMLQAGEVEDPQEFERKLRLLSDQWQSVIRRSTQRKSIINTFIQNWHAFNSLAQQLRSWLAEKEAGLKVLNIDTVSLQQVRTLLDKVRTAQKEFSMQEDSFRKVHDLGSSLLQQADFSATLDIKQCASNLQNKWLQVYNQLEEHRVRLEAIQKDWQECEDDIEEILAWLKNIRSILAADIPHTYDDLQSGLSKCKDITVSFANSEDKRQSLIARERNLSRFIQAEDMNVLHQRIRLLNKQWDELVSQAGFREQRLRDFTFHWSDLGQQIQALIRWIDDMEMKIVSSRESHVEDLLNKLEKDYQEAITDKGLEKEELLAKGRYLMKNSSEIRASDIEHRLQNLEDKWLHLLDASDFRRKKLHETVGAVRQLDCSMRNLTQWLVSMEKELYAPVVYQDCDLHEIQRQLQNTQNLQHDVEQHTAGVSSVLNLCEVLLHDCDACPTQTEFDALHHAMKNLDRRWKNICNLCPERRARIEETWHLWEDFQTDCKRFSLWLGDMETEVGNSEVVIPGSSVSKEEIHRYESVQTKVLDHLESLEHINKQYRSLAKEMRTDSNGVLKATMQEVNDRWDALQLRVRAIMQGMRHSASVREDFVMTRASLLKWLMEVDMQLTNLEHLSQLDIHTKLKELKRIEEEVDERRHRIDYLNQAAALLIQQGPQQEAQQIQEEVNEFKTFSRDVLEHLVSCHLKLKQISSAQELQLRASEFGAHVALGAGPGTAAFDSRELETYLESSPPQSPPHKRRAGVTSVQLPKASVPPIRRSYSPGRSLSPSHQSRSSPSETSKDVTDYGGERWQAARRERNAKIDVLMEQLVDALKDASEHLDEAEQQLQDYSPSVTDSTSNFNQHLIACEGLINTIQHLDRVLKIETGAINIPSADLQIARVFERWEQLQSLASESDQRLSQQQHELVKFHTDVEALLAWMDEAEALQSTHSHIPSDITDLNIVIRQHKDFMVQLEAKKAHVLSVRLLSKNFVNTTPEGRQLRTRLKELDQRWEALTASAARTQQALQGALLKCEEFHHTVHDYLVWMERMEERLQRCEPVRLSHSVLWSKYMTLKELQRELEANQGEVLTLRETAEQLLVSGESPEMAAARDKTRIIANRLRSLLHLTSSYIESLETKLGVKSSSVDAREVRQPAAVHRTVRTRTRSPFAVLRRLLFGVPPISLPASDTDSVNLTTESKDVIASPLIAHPRRRPLLQRVLCAALPLQVLLLLLLGVACLVPVCEDDSYTCLLSNNMRKSLTPMLHYTQGAPPT